MKECPKCKKRMPEELRFCESCGTKLEVKQEALIEVENGRKAVTGKEKIRKRKVLVLAVIVLLVIGMGSHFLYRNLTKDYINKALYIADGNLSVSEGKRNESFQISKDLLVNSKDTAADADFLESKVQYMTGTDVSENITICKKKNIIIYPDRWVYNDGGYDYNQGDSFTLYWRSLKDMKAEPVKIASEVYKYKTDLNCDRIFYRSGDNLYVYDFNDIQKIDTDVIGFVINHTGDRIVYDKYENEKYNLYLKRGEDEPVKIANNVLRARIEGSNQDSVSVGFYIDKAFENIYYINQDNILYKTDLNGNKTKIDTEVSFGSSIYVYDTGEIYYDQTIWHEENLTGLLEDDFLDTDQNMMEPVMPEEPEEPNKPWWIDAEEGAEEERAAYEKIYKKYKKEYEKYQQDLEKYYAEYDLYKDTVYTLNSQISGLTTSSSPVVSHLLSV